jgi:hypothetical protein
MTTIEVKTKLYRYWSIILTPILGTAFFLNALRIVNSQDYHNTDFFSFWLGGRMAAFGQNPYLTDIWIGGHHQFGASWISDATYLYPLPLSLLFAPLGLLTLYQAFVVWVLLTQCMIISSVILLLRLYPDLKIKHFILPLLAGVILFRPTIITLINGQLSGFLLLVLVCIIFLWESGKWWQGTVFLPILALKPNLGVPIIVLLSFYLILQRKTTSLIAGGISGLALLLTGLAQNSNWIPEFLRIGNTKLSQSFGFSPTIWGVSTQFCNYNLNCSICVGSVLGLFILIVYLILLVRKHRVLSPALTVGLTITVMLILTPYIWPYDQLLLTIPIITVTMNLAKAGYRFLITSPIFLVIDVVAIILLVISAKFQTEIWNVTIPLIVFGLLSWYLSKDRQDSQLEGTGY